jgi:Protein of unknown function (DUF4197)
MFRKMLLTGVCVLATLLSVHGTVRAGWGRFLERLTDQLQPAEQGLSQSDIVAGLREALKIGTDNAVRLTSKLGGYYKNPQIKIPLPERVQKVEKVLRLAGLGDQVTDFELSMNRAAEKAAPAAKQLFVDAIARMTFADARQILKGRANEATLYFKAKTYNPLEQRFKPLVHAAMAEVGITRSYQKLDAAIQALPLGDAIDVDLDQYVTAKALDGLFLVLSQEESAIRRDPAARVTDLLKKVFATQGT